MLNNRHRELLAAYVDGELAPRQQRAVLRLLQQSAEARELLRRMQQDAEALRQLPRARLERDLSAPTLRCIAERRLQPGIRRCAERPQPKFAAWVGFSAAAAVLLLVALGSYLYFSGSPQEGPNRSVTTQGKPEQLEPERVSAPAPKAKLNSQPPIAAKPSEPELVPPPAMAAADPPSIPAPDATIVAAPDLVAGMEMFRVAPVTQLQIVKLADLGQEPRRQQLLKDLAKERSYRMEAPVNNSIKALERLRAALTARGLALAIDQTAQVRMAASARLAKIRTNFVIYMENVTPDELVELFGHVAAENKAEQRKKGVTPFEAVVINAMTDADRAELCQLLGVKAKKLPDPPTGPLGVDVRKPLSDKTGDDIAKTLTGQGGVPRPDPGKPTAKPPERLALVMPYNPVRPRPDSPEIKQFLAARKPPRPGTVQVLLVLRQVGG